jgi:hypothetical protein
MTLEFLALPEVREVLFELISGDRFEKDLICNFDDEKHIWTFVISSSKITSSTSSLERTILPVSPSQTEGSLL